MKNNTIKITTLLLLLTTHASGHSATGDTLYVQSETANMREGPSTKHKIKRTLNRGHQLLEIYRKGSWIEVGAIGTDGKTGWIFENLTGKPTAKPAPKPPLNNNKQTARLKLINQLIARGVFHKIVKPADLYHLHVTPTYMRLNYDDKKLFARVPYLYHSIRLGKPQLIIIKHSVSGKRIGYYDKSGLNLD